jgi:bifunctional DNA-binding transcriptional regulator/antitoxin component of YhaV-PrlF toxin-antitoxin module
MKTTLTVDDDGVLTFPEGFLEKLGWKDGDVLQWIDNKGGSFSLKKHDET